MVFGGEPILGDGAVVGRVTSGGYGYVPVASAAVGTALGVEIFGAEVAATVSHEPLYDARGERIKGGA